MFSEVRNTSIALKNKKGIIASNKGLLFVNKMAWQTGFNSANNKLIRVHVPEIYNKKCQT